MEEFVSAGTKQNDWHGGQADTVMTIKGSGGTRATVTLCNTGSLSLGDLMGSLQIPH